jgi:putative N6-adenine-specific DNA methylase
MSDDDRGRRRARLDTFTVCLPGVEGLVESELAALGVRGRRRHGGVAATMTTRQLYAANLHLRTATRVVVRIARFEARSFAALERALRAVDWDPWIGPHTAVTPRATSHRSRLWHTGAVAERVAGVVPGHAAGPRPDRDGNGHGSGDGDPDPDAGQRVMLRVVDDRVTVSVDSSGEPLHRRGWRHATAKAPLRPTVAAAMLLSSGWRGQAPLVDPFCGSGTIPIEAALLARGAAPGLARAAGSGAGGTGFSLLHWPAFEPGTWASVVGAARAAARDHAGVPVVARDRDAGAITATLANAARAGVAGDLDVGRAALSDLHPPAGEDRPGWLVTNPPYGRRLRGGRDLRDLYARLGQVVGARLPGWTVGMLIDDPALAGHSHLPLAPAWETTNGGLAVRYLVTRPA